MLWKMGSVLPAAPVERVMGWGGLEVLQLRQVSGPLLRNTARSTILQKDAIVSVEQVGF